MGAEGRRDHCEAGDQVVEKSMVEEESEDIEGLHVEYVTVAAVGHTDVENPSCGVCWGHSSACSTSEAVMMAAAP